MKTILSNFTVKSERRFPQALVLLVLVSVGILSQPALAETTQCTLADIDRDNDGLIEICDLEGLNAMRYQLDGSGYKASRSATKITAGCAEGGCKGYELDKNLDFNNDASYSSTPNKVIWTTGAGWQPIGYYESYYGANNKPFEATFNGNGHTISNLMVNRLTVNNIGLFGYTNTDAEIINIGLIDVDIQGHENVGGLVGDTLDSSITNSYATGDVKGDNRVGGLVGTNRLGTITNSYATGDVKGDNRVGGLVGAFYFYNGTITNSYAMGSVEGNRNVGGLVGAVYNGTITNSYATSLINRGFSNSGRLVGFVGGGGVFVNSYWDTDISGISSSRYGVGLMTKELQSPTTATGIYSRWSTNVWDFGTSEQYPALKYSDGTLMPNQVRERSETLSQLDTSSPTSCSTTDIDQDDDGLIEICDLEGLSAIRYQLDGSGYKASSSATKITAGCAEGGCKGYELVRDLDFNEDASYRNIGNKARWTTVLGWEPIGYWEEYSNANSKPFEAIFKGNNYTISNLMINRFDALNMFPVNAGDRFNARGIGLFGYTKGTIMNVGLLNVEVRGRFYVGGLVGISRGSIIANSYVIGSVKGAHSTGILVGNIRNGSITSSYAMGSVEGHRYVGGLIGYLDWSTITNSYATGSVEGGSFVGGLVGDNWYSYITNSYATGSVEGGSLADLVGLGLSVLPVEGGSFVGGLAGRSIRAITDSYWDKTTSGMSSSDGGVGKTTTELQSPTGATGIYSSWSTNHWDFGTSEQYPTLKYHDGTLMPNQILTQRLTQIDIASPIVCSTADIDQDDDGLIEICDLEGLNAMRHQLDGSGYRASASAIKITAGCAEGGCKGYELTKDLDFDNDASYSNVANKARWTTGSGWQPIGYYGSNYSNNKKPFRAIFEGNNYTISNLMINSSYTYGIGLFGYTELGAEIINVGVLNVDIQGNNEVGGLVGRNWGSSVTNSYATGSVEGWWDVGGLVGGSYNGTITNSYATVSVTGGTGSYSSVGGLVGYSYNMYTKSIMNSYATGNVTGGHRVGGLVGSNQGSITNSYATGSVEGSRSVGGLAGSVWYSSITNSYWDKTTSGMSSSRGGVGKTTTELQSPTTSTGIYSSWSTSSWDFGTSEQYPALKYSDGTLMPNQGRERPEEPAQVPRIEIAGVPKGAVNEGERITLTASSTSSASSVSLIYQWQQTSGETLLTSPTSGSSVTLDVPEDYVAASENTGNVVLILEASNDVGSTTQQVSITIAKRNNGGIAALGVPNLNERELTAPSIDLSGDPDGSGNNIRYQWQSRQSAQAAWVNVPAAGINERYTIPADTTGIVQYRVVMSYTDGQGYGEEVISGVVIYERRVVPQPNIDIASLTSCGTADIDQDDDGLIEICNLEGLNAIRYQMDGSGYRASSSTVKITAGCAESGCRGYELSKDLDFNDEASYSSTSNKVIWTTGSGWEPIGVRNSGFEGAFDGNGYTISNLMVNRLTVHYIGLFGYTKAGARIVNVGLLNLDIIGRNNVGGLIGRNSGSILDSYVAGSVKGSNNVGGLVGYSHRGGTITTSYATGSVEGSWWIGGLVGDNRSSITNSYAAGAVSGNRHVGGLVGWYSEGSITNSYATGSVSGNRWVGGLVGSRYSGTIRSSYWDKTTSRISSSAGGVGKTTTELQSPMTATGIYSSWSISSWDFGTREQYPALKYSDGTLIPNQVRERPEEPAQEPQIEIAGVPEGAVDEGESITLTASSTSSANSNPLIYQWQQTSGKTLLTNPTSGSSVTLNVPEDHVVESANTSNLVLTLEANNNIIEQIAITITKSNNGGIAALGVPNLNERELTAPSIDLSGDPDGGGNNIGYQWQSKQSAQAAWVNVQMAGTNERYTIPADTAGIVQYRVVVSYTDGQGYEEEIESEASIYEGNTIPSVEIAGVPTGAVDEGERITLTASSTSNASSVALIYHWQQTSDKILLTSPTSGSSVTLDVPEDYVAASENTGNVELILEASNDVGSTTQQVSITIAKSNNGGIAALGVPSLNERELTASSIDISSDPDGSGNNIRYQWQIRQSTQTAWANVPAAGTNERYIIPADTAGVVEYRVVVSYTDGQGYGEEVMSVAVSYEGIDIVSSIVCSTADIDQDDDGLIEICDLEGLDAMRYQLDGRGYRASASATKITAGCAEGGCKGYELSKGLDFDNDASYSNAANKVTWTTGSGWQPIGTSSNPFNATFRANKYSISNLMIARSSLSAVGLFGKTGSQARIEGVGLIDADIQGYDNVGGLVGYNNGGTITNSYITGIVRGDDSIGGLVGYNNGGTITNSYITGIVRGDDSVGGLVGDNYGPITNSYTNVEMSGDAYIGGIVGCNFSGGTVTNSYTVPRINRSSSSSGGLLGYNSSSNGRPVNSYWDKEVSRISSGNYGVGLTTEELQSSMTTTGIYSSWSTNNWDFGTREQYPALKYSDGTLMLNQVREIPEELLQIEIAGVPAAVAVNEGKRITLTGSYTSSASSIPLIYQWQQTSGKTLLTSPTSGSSVTLDVPKDYVVASENIGNVVLILEASNDVESTAQQVLITITKRNNDGIAALGVPSLNERELTAPSIDLSSDPDGSGSNIRYRWQIRQSLQPWVNVQRAGTNALYTIPADIAGIVEYRVVVSYIDGQGYEEEAISGAMIYETGIEIASLTSCSTADIDQDDDGLIEICDLEGLNTIRYQLDGSGYRVTWSATKITAGCAEGGCKGYELNKNLDFDDDASYSNVAKKVRWTTGLGWESIGRYSAGFKSTFEGNDYTISNLMVNRLINYVGLFAVTMSGAKIINVGLLDVDIQGRNYVGGLVGFNRDQGSRITNSYVTGSVKGNSSVGGLVGYNEGFDITNSYATSSVKGDWNVGGLVGFNPKGTITNSYATGAVEGSGSVGGLVGRKSSSGAYIITNSYATGSVKGYSQVGGLVGVGDGITNSYAMGAVEGDLYVGGLVGYVSYYGYHGIKDSYATGSVKGKRMVGGLAGHIYNYSGFHSDDAITKSYWDKTASRMSSSAGGVGKTTTELQSPIGATGIYSSWSTSSWDFGTREQYPALKYRNGTLMPNQVRERPEEPVQVPQIDIANVSTSAVNEGERITLTGSYTSSASSIPLIYQWTQTSGKTLLPNPTSGSSVTLDVPEDYVVESANTGNVVLILEANNNIIEQIIITIAKRNNGGILSLSVPAINERELTAPPIDLSGDPDGSGSNIRYQWQIRQSTQTAWVNVSAAGTNERYTIPAVTAGIVQYRVVVSYTDRQGYEEEVSSGVVIYETSIEIADLTSCGTADIDQDDDGLIEICNLEGLNAMRYQLDGSGYKVSASATKINVGCAEGGCKGYELEKDLDFNDDDSYSSTSNKVIWTTGEGWLPIGIIDMDSLSCEFKGNNHTISNLMINTPLSAYVGLFFMTDEEAIIDGVNLHKVDIVGRREVGSLVSVNERGTIRNIQLHGVSIQADGSEVGGLVGMNEEGTIRNIQLHGVSIQADGSQVGGLVGMNEEGIIINSRVSGDSYAITNWVEGEGDRIGGLVGENEGGRIINSYAVVNIQGRETGRMIGYHAGGLVGYNTGQIINSYADGSVVADENVGGLIGKHEAGEIINSYATGSVEGERYVGGLVGLFGYNRRGDITNSYAAGSVTGSSYVGGLVGYNRGNSITNSYWDKTTSGRSRSAGGVGKTTTKLQSPITPGSTSTEIYYSWSTNDWDFGTSVQYPALKYSDGTLMPNQRRQIEIAGVPTGAVNEGESITMTASSTSSASSIPLIYQWKQTSGKTLLISPTSGNTVILDVPEDYVAASENTGNVVLILEASNDVGSTTQQISITIAKRNNGGIAALSIPNLNERELTAPSIDSSGDPDGGGNNIGYQWQSRQSTRMAWVDVPVAGTNERYTIPADTAGIVQYRVVMSYTDGQGYGEEVMSVAVSYEGIDIASSIVCSTADIDQDDDGLIEICDLEGLSAIRHQLDGSGYKASSSATKITAGCAGDGCKGYELIKDLDFNDYDSYSSTSNKVIWTTGAGWEPIGYYRISADNEPFTATFKGNGHNISNLMIDRSDARGVGLFGYTKAGARIVNVGLLNLDIVGRDNVGGLIGRNSGSILDSYVAGSVKGDWDVGGLVGYNRGGTITNSYVTGDVTGTGNDVGGLVGYSHNSDIANSYVTGSVKGDWDVGGLVGHTLDSSITNSDAAGVVEGRIYVGGLVGKNTYTSITRSYVIGSVKGDDYVGGLVGYNRSSITNSYAKAFVKGYDYVGGLAGYNRSSITNSYATGSVKGDNYVGGLAGDNGNSSITNSYWDKTASRISSSTGGVGKTATELQSPTGATGIYSRWSTNVWDFGTSEQYPALKYRSGTLMPNQRLMQIEIASLTSCGTVDIDQDDDGLIEICNLEGLNAIRHQPDGSGYRVSVSTIKITAGCAEGGCKGYELNKDLDFNDYDSYSSTPNKVIWTTGSGWQPIGTFDYPFDAMFRANKYSISNLMIARSSFNRVGLFGNIGSQARIEGVSLIDADVRGHWTVGGLAGGNHGGTITNSYSTGSVTGSSYVGGLVGYNRNGTITNSYATGNVEGNRIVGGLVGYNRGNSITNSYAAGSVTGSSYVGGLVGYNRGNSITNSYWDKTTSKMSRSAGGVGKTTTELQSPIRPGSTSTEIYYGWSTNSWDFGTSVQYPALKYSDGTLMPNQRREIPEEPAQMPQIEIAGVPTGAVNEGESITLTASSTSSASSVLLIYHWMQTSGETLFIEPTTLNRVTLDVPEDYVAASENTDNVVLMLEASNDVGITTQQISITIAKSNNGGIEALGIPNLNERELTAPSIDLSGDPDGGGNNIRYQWQIRQSPQTAWINVPAAGTNERYTIPADITGIVEYRVVVSYTDGQGYEEQVASGASSYRGNTSPSIELLGSGSYIRLLAGQTTAISVVISEVDVGDVVTLMIESTPTTGIIRVEPSHIVLGASLSETRTTQFQLTAEQVGSAKLLLTAIDDSQTATDRSGTVELTIEIDPAPFTPCGYADIDRDNDGLIEICNLEGLNAMRNQLLGTSYKENTSAPGITTGCAEGGCKGYELDKDLDFNDDGSYKDIANKAIWTTGEGWQPIGVRGNGFSSIFEGNSYTISNLMIDRSFADNIGLFGIVDGQSKINGIGLLDVDINAQSRVGGLAGHSIDSNITNSYVTGNVIGQLTVGGLVGQCSNSRVSNSYAIGRVEAMGTIGGIDAGSSSAVGGLVGYLLSSSVSRSHAIGSVKGVGGYAGGLIGSNTGSNGSIITSYAFVDVEGGSNYTGGLVGSNNGINNKISNSYAIGKVVGEHVVGGLAGHNRSRNTITNSYSFSNVKGSSQVGGLVGNNVGTITNSYAIGSVAGNVDQRYIGGLVGASVAGSTNNSYWDKTTSGRAASVGGIGQTTAQLQVPTVSGSTSTEVYHGWSEEIWDFGTSEQYPALKYSDGTLMPDQRIGLLSLSALATEELSIIFNTEVFDYRLLIDSGADAVQLLPTATHSDANINIVSGSDFSESVVSGSLSSAISLNTTATTLITIEVEFDSGASRLYRITISRAEQSAPAQVAEVDTPFEYTIPIGILVGANNDMNNYEVTSMPSWLRQTELQAGLMFSGTPEIDYMNDPLEQMIEIQIDNGDGTTQTLNLMLQIDSPTTGTVTLQELEGNILQLENELRDDNGIEEVTYLWEHCPVGANAFSELVGVDGMSYAIPQEEPYMGFGTAYRVRTTVVDGLGQRSEHTTQIELQSIFVPEPSGVIRIRAKVFLEGFLQ